MRKIRSGQRALKFFQMIREPIVIVVQIGDIFALGALQRQMSIACAALRFFWEIEHPKSSIRPSELSGDEAGCRVHPIANDEDFKIDLRLRERTASSDTQEVRMVMGRNDNCEKRHCAEPDLSNALRAVAANTWEPSRTPSGRTRTFSAPVVG